ncbi:hypothetical protein [Derxia gummosa]|uniref:6-phosphogluconate dehydrogenase n=1 Tax=Derxia gummosa DSM 723 TaxID=1121388 RepID=A0A8B6X6E5_9BURK|nr:hypothetical protein [Derxia gummosa]
MKKVLLVLVALVVLAAGWLWVATHWSYSSGERAGWVQKFSRKGWVCKTWEGELSMVAMPGTVPEKFEFTVLDDEIARRINGAMGRRVTLHYEQRVGLPGSCFGDTRYYVSEVQVFEELPLGTGGARLPANPEGQVMAPNAAPGAAPAR